MTCLGLDTFLVVGLMSGTSMDGIDAAIIRTDGLANIKEIGHTSLSYHVYIYQLLKTAEMLVRKCQGNLTVVRTLNFENALCQYLQTSLGLSEILALKQISLIKKHLKIPEKDEITFDTVIQVSTDLHEKAVHDVLRVCELTPKQIKVIGYHGQTLYHNPHLKMTVQVGDGQRLASRTGIDVIDNFREKDVKLGGQGAPFSPLYHQALAVRDGRLPLAVVNCGGISSVTIIKNKHPEELLGFDPGPGNNLIDRFVQLRTQGKDTMDLDGKYGSHGHVNKAVLQALHQKAVVQNDQNYLLKTPPKSLDVGDLKLISELDALSIQDGCATLAAFTADTIVQQILTHIRPPYPRYWILAGGGWYNPTIKKELSERLKIHLGDNITIETADEAGWNSRALEAQIFGYLAVRHLKGWPTSYPSTTGVPYPVVGGDHFHPKTNTQIIDLSEVTTESKGKEYQGLESKALKEQFLCLFKGMTHAVAVVKNNKDTILSIVRQIYLKWAPIAPCDRHLYIAGAGTSGRLGRLNVEAMCMQKQFVLDSDIAGGMTAFYKAVDGAEDKENLAQKDVTKRHVTKNDVIFGVSASGRTPYVVHYLKMAKNIGALTVGIDNSLQSLLSSTANCAISNNIGSEYPRGSTRMKSGTSQHLTLQLLLNLLVETLSDGKIDELSKKFDIHMDTVKKSLHLIEDNAFSIMDGAEKLACHFMDLKNKDGRIVYVGQGVRGLFGVIDGTELLPTYSWSRVAYIVPELSDLLKEKVAIPKVGPQDFVIATDLAEKFSCPYIDLSGYDTFSLCIVLKLISTLFALQSGWILEGEMIALDPRNPNKKLKARRVQILKNLGTVHTDKEALEILQRTNQDLILAVADRRKKI